MYDLTRRGFVEVTSGALSLAGLPSLVRAVQGAASGMNILFQGDSITDCGRDRDVASPNEGGGLGTGYPLLIASDLLHRHPERGFRFFNRGISGNKIPDLSDRWDADAVALKPDLISILVGVNDFWHRLLNGYTGTVSDYETGYRELLARTVSALPGVRLVVMEPFVLKTGAVDGKWFPEFDARRAAAARVAQTARATWVPLQEMFDRLSQRAPADQWLRDGVHPTPAGHAAIAEQWLKVVKI
jgi:lysophospholipase L1-like esterase